MLIKEAAVAYLVKGASVTLTMNFALSRICRQNLIINPAGGDEVFINKVLKSPRVQLGALLINTVVPAVVTEFAYYAVTQNNLVPGTLELALISLAFGASTAASLCFTTSHFAKERLNIESVNFSKTNLIAYTLLNAYIFAEVFYR